VAIEDFNLPKPARLPLKKLKIVAVTTPLIGVSIPNIVAYDLRGSSKRTKTS
jgi:hypothetical protein